MVDGEPSAALERALQGDANAFAEISAVDHSLLQEAEKSIGAPLVVKRAAAVSILEGLIDGQFSPFAVQAWASFMRRGFVEGASVVPIQPIDIEFEDAWEDAISAAVSRLDEIGDVIDGEVTSGEAFGLLQLLREP